MTWIEASGYLASLLVLGTFCMHTMLALRAVAICSNMAFVVFGIGAGVYPVLALHVILLPVNVAHLFRMLLVLRRAKSAADTDLSPEWLQPFMRTRRIRAGDTIFKKGDYADTLYLVASGRVELPEIRMTLRPGDVFGEVGLFSVDQRRTQTARALSDLELFWITADELMRLCERNPGLSLYFLRLVATRLATNATQRNILHDANRVSDSERIHINIRDEQMRCS
ncbi:MAG TPA: cyclic nucleotide-binding domain-containing protein [Bradyrhizobium sp.]|nr:cyclic nucleotide-binding domain-containing protein [Bradyrhizobium sp.]